MRFDEKFIKLRKEKMLSKSEIAEKLNVDSETINNWEEGLSRPDMEKMLEISRFFQVDLDKLTDDNIDLKDKNKAKDKGNNINTILVIVIIVIVVGLLLSFVFSFFGLFGKIFNNSFGIINSISDDMNGGIVDKFNDMSNAVVNKAEISTFNSKLESRVGTQSNNATSWVLDDVNTNNKKNKDNIVTVTYNGNKTSDETEIINIKHSLQSEKKYEITFDYNEDNYIYNVNIADI